MPYSSITEVPDSLKTAGLSLAQANMWAKIYDSVKQAGSADNPGAVAWAQFKKSYKKEGDGWVKKQTENHIKESYRGVVLNMTSLAKPRRFRFIAQTEGTHHGSQGPLTYKLPELLKAAPSIIGVDIKDDPTHADAGQEPFYKDFADITTAEVITLTRGMIQDYELSPELEGKGAIECVAEVYDSSYDEKIRRGKIKLFSTEHTCDIVDNDEGGKDAVNIKYTSVAAIRDNPADVGAVMLEVLNQNINQGGNTMTPEEQKKMDELSVENQKLKTELDELKVKTDTANKSAKELEEKNTALNKLNDELKGKEDAVSKLQSKVVEQETILNQYVSKDRAEQIKEITSNQDILTELSDPVKTSSEVFNKEITKLKAISDEVKANAAVIVNQTGRAMIANTKDDYTTLFGESKEDIVARITNKKKEAQ